MAPAGRPRRGFGPDPAPARVPAWLSIVQATPADEDVSRLSSPSDNAGPVACIVLSGGGNARPGARALVPVSLARPSTPVSVSAPDTNSPSVPDASPENIIGCLGRRRFRPGVTRAPTERVPAGVVPGHERRVGILHRLVRGASTASSSSSRARRLFIVVVVVVEASSGSRAAGEGRDRGRVGRRRPPRPRTRRTTRRPPCRRFREPAPPGDDPRSPCGLPADV